VAAPLPLRRILVAGIGNVLRGDDGFGPAVIQALEASGALPPQVCTLEVGIGGISLVHELLAGCHALIIVDAVDRGGAPGTLYVLEPEVPEAEGLKTTEHAFMATDLHEIVPGRVLLMARALGVLPPQVRIIGCQPAETEEFSLELTPTVAGVVPQAVRTIRALFEELSADPPLRAHHEH
jgi:hydrogenase maturation protease